MKYWPHAPFHSFNTQGTYMVTGVTVYKSLIFKKDEELDLLHDLLLELASHYQWNLEAWAVFPNHYHFIAQSPEDSTSLVKFISHLHSFSAKQINKLQNKQGRAVWYQYWDTKITYHGSYLARLNYVMKNPVKHGLVSHECMYKWCSQIGLKKMRKNLFVRQLRM